MPATVVIGAQWGDEGKGKVVDLLAERSGLSSAHLQRLFMRWATSENVGPALEEVQSLSDQEIEEATRAKASTHPEFQPFPAWRETFADRLRGQQG